MNFKDYKFKTNINCSNCLKQVMPLFEKIKGLKSWRVDLLDENKLLYVTINPLEIDQLIDAVEEAGFLIE